MKNLSRVFLDKHTKKILEESSRDLSLFGLYVFEAYKSKINGLKE